MCKLHEKFIAALRFDEMEDKRKLNGITYNINYLSTTEIIILETVPFTTTVNKHDRLN